MRLKQEEIMVTKLRYLGGLNKLMFAAEQVRYFVSAVSRMLCLLVTVMMDAGIIIFMMSVVVETVQQALLDFRFVSVKFVIWRKNG